MQYRLVARRGLLVVALLLVAVVARELLIGALGQLRRTMTRGQQIETVVQLVAVVLSLLVSITCFWWRRSARGLRAAWAASLAIIAGLSSLVRGPPMPGIGLLFAAATLLAALGLNWALRFALAESPRWRAGGGGSSTE